MFCKKFPHLVFLLGMCAGLANYGAAQETLFKLRGLRQPVKVIRDGHAIPHIYAQNAQDAYFTLGYLHASDRLLEMDFLRRRARGELAELLGEKFYPADLLMRQIGIRRTAEAGWQHKSVDPWVRKTLQAYCEGVNARIAEITPAQWAKLFGREGYVMPKWTPVDAIAFVKYMGWDQSGTDDDLWFGLVADKIGMQTFNELWPIDRPFEIPIVPNLWAGMRPGQNAPALKITPDLRLAFQEIIDRFNAQPLVFRSDGAFGSNNWVIDGQKSATGKPMLANDPHLGFQLPSLWYIAHLVAPGLNVIGVTFPGVPYVIIGHNARVAWGMTNMQADAVDFFLETFDANDSTRYLHQGKWQSVVIRTDTIHIAGKPPRVVQIASTVHGPILNQNGQKIAMQWTGLVPTFEWIALAKFNRARNLQDFKKALSYLGVPALNIVYADIEGNIAMAPHGNLPIRKRGLGRIPHEGASGDYDWVGLIPREELPFALNPSQHFLASANQRPAPAGYPHYLGWMWDPGYRARRINALLRKKRKFSLQDMQHFQTDVFSLPASIFVPILIADFDRAPFGDSRVRTCMEILKHWDFRMLTGLAAPVIWTVWFDTFRTAVWQDDFDSLHIPATQGSWGFTGDNRREPELEVLEYLTRYNPRSPYFDDKTTTGVEHRDQILRKSFIAAVEKLSRLAEKLGSPNPREWQWGKTHTLSIPSITGRPELGRSGLPIPGGRFTLNPGGGLFGTSGGASWRMIVDFSDLTRSVGAYPGGQSGNAASPYYDDQLPLWAKGDYLQLYFYAAPENFPKRAILSLTRMVPK